ncbi:YceI family protein [Rhizobiaceae bacterium n13]|uniref:YceI family protein n=1 Tax=Ferirhizobium litorale TaxID=2927786 RepID=A0AAE3QDB9_9HYPH|nr:YceI family protein [Fererhizobium litorale]MDI7861308.1 YceI family protein [Fererhizobium litorale]MDI7921455.1 YceI family protein [Fererhizobium litorale]
MRWKAAGASAFLFAALVAEPGLGAPAPDLQAAAGTYRVTSASRIGFSIGQVGGGGIQGTFGNFSGTFRIDGGNIGRSTVQFTIYPQSVVTRERRMEDFLRSSAVFHAEKFPTVTFRSTAVRQTASDQAIVEGLLTARGTTRPETFNVRLTGWNRSSIAFEVTGSLYRSRYGMDVGTPVYSNVVRFDMDIRGRRN